MTAQEEGRDISPQEADDRGIASRKKEAAGAAWEGADLERAIEGEDPASDSIREAGRWIAVYSHLVNLEQELFDVLARMIPSMPTEAQKEAELTNLPVLASQGERFRHRLDYWTKRRDEIAAKGPEAR